MTFVDNKRVSQNIQQCFKFKTIAISLNIKNKNNWTKKNYSLFANYNVNCTFPLYEF